jgi:hypothetical protein
MWLKNKRRKAQHTKEKEETVIQVTGEENNLANWHNGLNRCYK